MQLHVFLYKLLQHVSGEYVFPLQAPCHAFPTANQDQCCRGGLKVHKPSHIYLEPNLESATAAALHQIADVSWFNACSNERLYIVMIQFLQLHTQRHADSRVYAKISLHKKSRHAIKKFVSGQYAVVD